MSGGFVSSPPATTPPPEPEAAIEHDGFFPGVKLSAVRDLVRVPTQVTDPRLKAAIVAAMLTVGAELRTWRGLQLLLGFDTLAAVSDEEVGGAPLLVQLYERAIACFVAAELADTHHDISASADGKDRAEERALAADEHRRNGTHAIRDMLDVTRAAGAPPVTRTSVALI